MKRLPILAKIVIWALIVLTMLGIFAEESLAGVTLMAGIIGVAMLLFSSNKKKRRSLQEPKPVTPKYTSTGTELKRDVCPDCRARLEPGDRYCPQCGVQL